MMSPSKTILTKNVSSKMRELTDQYELVTRH